MTRWHLILILLLGPCCSPAAAGPDFARDVRPILSNHCFQCHGPDDEARQAELRLDTREGLRSVLGKVPADSDLRHRVFSDDADLTMPPAAANKPLSQDQKQTLLAWLKDGAPWRQHWSFERPTRPDVPPASDWARNEVDVFAERRMRSAGLAPAAEADSWILLRRLWLDLTGLPPTPQEASEWHARIWTQQTSNDERVSANEVQWQALITHLLHSPAWGERWARRWLDLARYADTNGYEKDRDRSIWPYRDWVIHAFNNGMPFDQFTIEQIAGDMLPNATQAQRVATGFHRNTMLNEEGGIDPLEYRFHAMTDRVATTGTTWLGLTLGCAQCHTHKYDPISHTDYYRFMALLNNADEPTLRLTSEDTKQQNAQRRQQAESLIRELPKAWPGGGKTIPADSTIASVRIGDQAVPPQDDGSVVVASTSKTADYRIRLTVRSSFDRLRLHAFTVGEYAGPGHTPHGNFVLSEIEVFRLPPDNREPVQSQRAPLSIESATATAEQSGYEVMKAFDGKTTTGWGIDRGEQDVAQQADAVFVLAEAINATTDDPVQLEVVLRQHTNDHTLRSFRLEAANVDPQGQDEHRDQAFASWLQTQRDQAISWTTVRPAKVRSTLPILTVEPDDCIFAAGDTAKRDEYYITLPAVDEPVTGLMLEALPDDRLPNGGPGTTYYEGTIGDFFLNEFSVTTDSGTAEIRTASHSYANDRYGQPSGAHLTIDGDVQTGWSVHTQQGMRHVAVFQFTEPIPAGTPLTAQMIFGRHFASSLGRFRFAVTSATHIPSASRLSRPILELLSQPENTWPPDAREKLLTAFLMQAPQMKAKADRIRTLRQPQSKATTLVMRERPAGETRPTFRHHRGEFLQPKEQVVANTPEVLPPVGTKEPNRLDLARWLVSPENPLTARVVVNRHWTAFFGTGIVRTVDDFGLQGEFPSHPELLDWLAVTFVQDDAWSLRKLHRRIVSSSLYRQSAVVPPVSRQVDPDNRLLSHSPRFRLEAEIIRDRLLVAAGVYHERIGGPSVFPLQSTGVRGAAYRRGNWKVSSGPQRYRRSLYTFTKRTSPFAMLNTFDAPSGESCIARRNRSNNPLQALTLLNDVMLTDLARHAGRRAASKESTNEARLDFLFRSVLVRPPAAPEHATLMAYVQRLQQSFEKDPERAGKLSGDSSGDNEVQTAVWTAVARALFALDETVVRE